MTISINGGKINASVEELTAPTKDIIGPKFGTIAAMKTGSGKKKIRDYSDQSSEVMNVISGTYK